MKRLAVILSVAALGGGMSYSPGAHAFQPEVRMRRAIALVLSPTLSGRAAHRAPVADPLHNWRRWSPSRAEHCPGHATYDVDGRFDDVTDSTLTLGRPAGMPPLTINGAWVVRVRYWHRKRSLGLARLFLEAGFVGDSWAHSSAPS